jgi:uncharacterized membrane protein YoaK (UPF0700 family)
MGRGLAIVLALCLASGATDVLSFLQFGNVFTSAMTGNTALLAIAIARGHILAAAHSLTALVGFIMGAVLAESFTDRRQEATVSRRTVNHLLAIEIACLAACATLWALSGDPAGGTLYLVIMLSAIGMGIQGVAARIVDATGINTIVFTTVLMRIVTFLTEAVRPGGAVPARAPLRSYLGAFAAYALGGLLGAVLSLNAADALVWVPPLIVLGALVCSWVGVSE